MFGVRPPGWDDVEVSERRGQELENLDAGKRDERLRSLSLDPDVDRRTLPHPNRRFNDTWVVKLRRALRDRRGARLTAEDVEGVCYVLELEPAEVSAYLRRVGTLVVIEADARVTVEDVVKMGRRRSAGVERKHGAIRERLDLDVRLKSGRRGRKRQ